MMKGLKNMSTKRCKGCGAILQKDDPQKVGYSPQLDHDYCQACFRLAHYGEVKDHFHPDQIPAIKEKSLVLMVCSVMALDMLFFYPIHRYAPHVTCTYIINQLDLLPASTNYDELLKRIIKRAKLMKVPYQDIILMSAKHQDDMHHLKQYIESFPMENVYLLGVQNAGKTTIYKSLANDQKALAMNKAGLTQEALQSPLNDKQMLYDMPGLFQEGYMHQLFHYETYKKLLVQQTIRPAIYQMKAKQALMIEGLIGLTIYNDQTLVCYTNRTVKLHRTSHMRVEELMTQQRLPNRIYVTSYDKRTFKVPKGKHQITFADFSFVHVMGPTRIDVIYPKTMHISLIEALFS